MAQKISHTVISMLLCVISIIVIVFSSILGVGTDYAYNEVDNLLTTGVEKVSKLRMGDYNIEFVDELAAQPEILAIGDSRVARDIDYLPELTEIRNDALGENKNVIDISFINYHLLNFSKISLQKGDFDKDFSDWNRYYLYLGSGFKDVPLGTTFSTDWKSDFVVAGIMSDGQRLISDTLYDPEEHRTGYTYDGTYSVLVGWRGLSTSDMWLSAGEDYTLDEAVDKAFMIADKQGVDLKYTTLETMFDEVRENTAIMKVIFSRLMPIMCVACAVMIICMQLSDIYGSLHEYGVMCSVGFTRSDIEKTVIIKNVITFVTGFILSLPLVNILLRWWYMQNYGGKEATTKMLFSVAIPAAAILIICTLIISSIISVAVISRHTPVQMIGGHND